MRISRFLVLPLLAVAALAAAASWPAKVDPWVVERAGAAGQAEALLVLEQQADLSGASALTDKAERGRFVVERLRAAAASQGPLLERLAELGVPHRSFWVANMVWVRADLATLRELSGRADVARVLANPAVRLDAARTVAPRKAAAGRGVEPNVVHVGAPGLWAAGFSGQGVVVAGQDTGYEWQHPALVDQYRGFDGTTVDHDYSWHDAIHSGGGICGADSPEPCDDSGHGTHTMGTMVGDDGAGNQVGIAPQARWIGCRNMDQGIGTPATYAECFQFFIAPTRLDGSSPDPAMAPDVVNNSWVCPPDEGCTDPTVLNSVIEAVRSAGILVVASAGNDGFCETVMYPPALSAAAVTVGATDLTDLIASFSSRGPVSVDGSFRIKPDLVAPGVDIISSIPGGGYGPNSGTSMAGPHVSGVAALMLSAAPCLTGRPDRLEAALLAAAVPRTTAEQCGDVPGSSVPNNTYGWGALRAVVPGEDACALFADGFESGDTSGWSEALPSR